MWALKLESFRQLVKISYFKLRDSTQTNGIRLGICTANKHPRWLLFTLKIETANTGESFQTASKQTEGPWSWAMFESIQLGRDNEKTNILILGPSDKCSFCYTMLLIRLNWNSEHKENLEKYNGHLSYSPKQFLDLTM